MIYMLTPSRVLWIPFTISFVVIILNNSVLNFKINVAGDIGAVRYWLEVEKFNINSKDFHNNSILYYAVLCNHYILISHLLQKYSFVLNFYYFYYFIIYYIYIYKYIRNNYIIIYFYCYKLLILLILHYYNLLFVIIIIVN